MTSHSPLVEALQRNDPAALAEALARPDAAQAVHCPGYPDDAWGWAITTKKRDPLLEVLAASGYPLPPRVRHAGYPRCPVALALRHGRLDMVQVWLAEGFRPVPSGPKEPCLHVHQMSAMVPPLTVSYESGVAKNKRRVLVARNCERVLPVSEALLAAGVVPSPMALVCWLRWAAFSALPESLPVWAARIEAAFDAGRWPALPSSPPLWEMVLPAVVRDPVVFEGVLDRILKKESLASNWVRPFLGRGSIQVPPLAGHNLLALLEHIAPFLPSDAWGELAIKTWSSDWRKGSLTSAEQEARLALLEWAARSGAPREACLDWGVFLLHKNFEASHWLRLLRVFERLGVGLEDRLDPVKKATLRNYVAKSPYWIPSNVVEFDQAVACLREEKLATALPLAAHRRRERM